MDDTKTITPTTYTVAVGDTEYEFGRPDPELIQRMIIISHMNADTAVILEACTKWLSVAAGPTVWAAIMRQFLNGNITADDLVKTMIDLITCWTTSEEPTANAA
jgi:hypothetical protein